ncbi:MAG TPA: diacylglycerol kinase family protein [Solirubrobacteraceae bacterium]|nr:diacylglycerol kinase family protein [Solirubrobacteraceae bacterium]
MTAPVLLLINPSAGGGRAGRLASDVLERLRGEGMRVRSEFTRDIQHARELGHSAALAGEVVACLGGDGLFGAVADRVREVPDAVLAVLPGGRGNDLARVLGIGQDPVAACGVLARGVARKLDLGEAAGKAFVGIASAGFDSDANRIANEAPSRLGDLVYAYGALRALIGWRPARFTITLEPDGDADARQTCEIVGYSVAAANSRAYGGGMLLAPTALLDDGMLDVVAIERVNKARFLANLPKVFKGTHVKLDSVRCRRVREVQIASDRPFTLYADGDPIAELPTRVRALPGAVSVLVPTGDTPSQVLSGAGDTLSTQPGR